MRGLKRLAALRRITAAARPLVAVRARRTRLWYHLGTSRLTVCPTRSLAR
jgi:hypothetical protein